MNISSIRSAEFEEQLGDLKILIVDIQSSMEKDQYKSLSAVNKRIKELEGLTSSINKRMGESNKVFNKNITDTLTQIAGIRNNIKALSQDPNMSSKY